MYDVRIGVAIIGYGKVEICRFVIEFRRLLSIEVTRPSTAERYKGVGYVPVVILILHINISTSKDKISTNDLRFISSRIYMIFLLFFRVSSSSIMHIKICLYIQRV